MSFNIWIDHNGRKIDITSMSKKWLNNIKKYLRKTNQIGSEKDKIIKQEINRRKKTITVALNSASIIFEMARKNANVVKVGDYKIIKEKKNYKRT